MIPSVPPERREPLERIIAALASVTRVVLTTHVNADGDGAGCEAALACWLTEQGKQVHIVNPTPFPELYRYLVADATAVVDPGDARRDEVLARAELVFVVDTREPGRLGRLPKHFGEKQVVVLDHHPAAEQTALAGVVLQDPAACAAGELVYDLLQVADAGAPWPSDVVEGVYVAILTDTGSFRYANTGERTHLIAADLLRRGADPESVFRRIFGSVPLRRVRLLQAALERLEHEPESGLTWVGVPRQVVQDEAGGGEDMDIVMEHARSVEGTHVAVVFRELPDGGTKVSFRSNGELDVNRLARLFGGGGHTKAAGALLGASLEQAQAEVLAAVRPALESLGGDGAG